ncbi:TIGR03111 family XrtG-associated glycosyltransferase [Levilactobacillus zymae]|uniref:TIGR03111 family XrtG-associated glycosyltransferase n=1 Tax=Levilactobacillus zymae TaxID=267363 RepID=UPI0028B69B10|nr:TIGR03111 family XrtG-associated glycosyltransferase [Levilactobacillus zymae]MDT6979537.1 putative glycosyltransferase, exosortase G system-associated [Levilactobacillus zymae]
MGFWITWTIIPVIVEIIPSMISAFRVYYQGTHQVHLEPPAKWPMISILVPVYNSEDTLFDCLDSIAQSTYPKDSIQVIVADNQSTDNSFGVFADAQNHFADLHLSIIHTEKGKAQALNVAMYNAIGTYIINIDSDGRLEPHALTNLVLRFENDPHIAAMTGTILSNKHDIMATKRRRLRTLQRNEYFEYAQAFLSGRTIESGKNELFTMSGAFSAFRCDVLYSTFMYNTETVGEDTDMTFQIRQRLGDKIILCHDAIFYIGPISGWGELYTQRQRWQRGELEAVHNYNRGKAGLDNFFNNFLVRRLMIDHTFMFPKMIWFFASIVLLFFRYSAVVLAASYILIYFLYVLVEALNFICVRTLLANFPEERKFYDHQWWTMFTLPGYNLVCFWFRLIGTINMMVSSANWTSKRPNVEAQEVRRQVKADAKALWENYKQSK